MVYFAPDSTISFCQTKLKYTLYYSLVYIPKASLALMCDTPFFIVAQTELYFSRINASDWYKDSLKSNYNSFVSDSFDVKQWKALTLKFS